MRKINLEEVKSFIKNQGPGTKVYIGADSERFSKGKHEHYAEFYLVIVVHINGRHGCKIFGEVQVERDYDSKINKPINRLMTEVYKIAELYLKLADVLENRDIEVHLDINPDEKFNSSIAVQQAIGYIKGVCNVVPMVKPQAFAASYAADRLKSLN